MRLTVEIELEVDQRDWAAEYGTDPGAEARADIRAYFDVDALDAIRGAIGEARLFGPLPHVRAIAIGTHRETFARETWPVAS